MSENGNVPVPPPARIPAGSGLTVAALESLFGRGRPSAGAYPVPVRGFGAHRRVGLAGPTRRYVLIVSLLAGTASLPILAAIGTGSAATGWPAAGGTTPFIAPPSDDPALVVPFPVSPPTRHSDESAFAVDLLLSVARPTETIAAHSSQDGISRRMVPAPKSPNGLGQPPESPGWLGSPPNSPNGAGDAAGSPKGLGRGRLDRN